MTQQIDYRTPAERREDLLIEIRDEIRKMRNEVNASFWSMVVLLLTIAFLLILGI